MKDNELITRAKTETLWSVLSKFSVVIPRMQRDYAQGRENTAAKRIRNNFIKEIFGALDSYSKGDSNAYLDLNFIYGNVNKNNEFFPIDGQQRLTTLFLFHWYLASFSRKGALLKEDKDILARFQYQSREVSGDFCTHLVNDVCVDVSLDLDVIREIRDYYWFYGDYNTDPTICSMLVMLEDIDVAAKKLDPEVVKSYFDLLKLSPEHSPIRFLFLDLDDVGMTDSIYIKMNARGKALTPFENFKAQLLVYLNNYKKHFGDDFIDSVNGEWSNFFWKCCDEAVDGKIIKSAEKMDDCMMRFFRFMMQVEFIVKGVDLIAKKPGTKDKNVRKIYTELEQDDDYAFMDHLYSDEFASVVDLENEKTPVVTGALFERIKILLSILMLENGQKDCIDFSFLDFSEFSKSYINDSDVFLRMIGAGSERKFTATDSIKISAEFAFLVKYADKETFQFTRRKELNRWMRYIHNLATNTESSSKEHYCYCINNIHKKLDELDETASNILDVIADDTIIASDNSGFQREQADEERLKARLLIDNYHTWKDLISEAENTKLDGEIQCLLSFSSAEGAQYSPEKFSMYANRMKLLFGENYSRIITGRMLRALLSVDLAEGKLDLSDKKQENSCFLFTKTTNFNFWSNSIDGIGNESDFRRFLRNDNSYKRETLKKLLDMLHDDDDPEHIDELLDEIIRANMIKADSSSHHTDRFNWMSILVKDPFILDSLEFTGEKDKYGYVFRNPCRYIRKVTVDKNNDPTKKFETVYLLERTVLNSNHRELFTYELYLEALRKKLPVSYKIESSGDTSNYLEYKDKNGHSKRVTRGWYQNGEVAYLAKDITLQDNQSSEEITPIYLGDSIIKTIGYISNDVNKNESNNISETYEQDNLFV